MNKRVLFAFKKIENYKEYFESKHPQLLSSLNLSVSYSSNEEEISRLAKECNILFADPYLIKPFLCSEEDNTSNLEWVQSSWAGFFF